MPENLESRKPFEFRKLIELAYLVVILSAFSWAKEFLLPIVLAVLISFLLMPIVNRLERWKLHPILAVLGVVAIAFAFIGLLCATISVETLDLVNSLPKYRDNITSKWSKWQWRAPMGKMRRSRGQHKARSVESESESPKEWHSGYRSRSVLSRLLLRTRY